MAEFQFSCPKCKKRIQCDSTYVGSQINCPICQQAIIVPPVQSSAAVLEVKISTVRTVAIVGVSILALVGIVMLAVHFLGPKTVTFRAYVDGTDVVKISGRKLWIEHQTWQRPAKIFINGKIWNFAWNDKMSAPYNLRTAFNPANPESVKVEKRAGRGSVSIAEMPTSTNDKTLAIQLDDGDQGGADWYEFTVSW
jgi:hypothetical protein